MIKWWEELEISVIAAAGGDGDGDGEGDDSGEDDTDTSDFGSVAEADIAAAIGGQNSNTSTEGSFAEGLNSVIGEGKSFEEMAATVEEALDPISGNISNEHGSIEAPQSMSSTIDGETDTTYGGTGPAIDVSPDNTGPSDGPGSGGNVGPSDSGTGGGDDDNNLPQAIQDIINPTKPTKPTTTNDQTKKEKDKETTKLESTNTPATKQGAVATTDKLSETKQTAEKSLLDDFSLQETAFLDLDSALYKDDTTKSLRAQQWNYLGFSPWAEEDSAQKTMTKHPYLLVR